MDQSVASVELAPVRNYNANGIVFLVQSDYIIIGAI
jgi:hypothetical protein